jgi:hypothetical protein
MGRIDHRRVEDERHLAVVVKTLLLDSEGETTARISKPVLRNKSTYRRSALSNPQVLRAYSMTLANVADENRRG